MRTLPLLALLLSMGCTATWTQMKVEPCENALAGEGQAQRSFYAMLVSLKAKKYEITGADPDAYRIDASLDRTVWSAVEVRKRHYEVDWLIDVEEDGSVTLDAELKEMPKRQYNVYLGWAKKIAAVFKTNRCRALDSLRSEVNQQGLIPDAPTTTPQKAPR